MIETLEDKNTREPAQEFQFEEERQLLKSAIGSLDDRESSLIRIHYFEGKSFEEIARSMSVSKQRISQLHAKAIKKLRDTLNVGSEQVIGSILEGAFMF
jgi:RNA polymerase sigma factor for flagellar operon FliA